MSYNEGKLVLARQSIRSIWNLSILVLFNFHQCNVLSVLVTNRDRQICACCRFGVADYCDPFLFRYQEIDMDDNGQKQHLDQNVRQTPK